MGLDDDELAKELQPSPEEELEDTRAAIRETYRSLGGGLPISMDGFRALHERVDGWLANNPTKVPEMGCDASEMSEALIKSVDQNGDEFVDKDEFMDYMWSLREVIGPKAFGELYSVIKWPLDVPLCEDHTKPYDHEDQVKFREEWQTLLGDIQRDAAGCRDRFSKGFAAHEVLPPQERFQELA